MLQHTVICQIYRFQQAVASVACFSINPSAFFTLISGYEDEQASSVCPIATRIVQSLFTCMVSPAILLNE